MYLKFCAKEFNCTSNCLLCTHCKCVGCLYIGDMYKYGDFTTPFSTMNMYIDLNSSIMNAIVPVF